MVVIFISETQLKKLEKTKQIFMDATFKYFQEKFYHLFNIIIDMGEGKFTFPIAHILMTHKSSYSYKIIFNFLKKLIKIMNINSISMSHT